VQKISYPRYVFDYIISVSSARSLASRGTLFRNALNISRCLVSKHLPREAGRPVPAPCLRVQCRNVYYFIKNARPFLRRVTEPSARRGSNPSSSQVARWSGLRRVDQALNVWCIWNVTLHYLTRRAELEQDKVPSQHAQLSRHALPTHAGQSRSSERFR